MAQTVPQFGFWKNAFSPAEANYRLKEAYPDRILFCGGVDPVWHGVEGAVRELERQVTEWGAVSMKFYQAHSNGLSWRIDDRKIAYPMWEKCLELGINNVQFHKGSPFGFEPMEALMPYDLQQAALDFPEMTFIIHHLGDPYIDESISIAGRNENVWMALSALVNVYPVMPREFWMRFGKCLAFVGPEKLLYGSEAFIWPNVQGYIDIMMNEQMPEDLQDGYGFPEITDEMRRMIMGENFARLLGIDIPKKVQELYGEPAEAGAQA